MGDEWCTAMAEEPPKIKAEFQAGVQLSFSQTSTMYLVHMLLTIVWCKIIWEHIWIKAYLTLFWLCPMGQVYFFWSDFSLAATC